MQESICKKNNLEVSSFFSSFHFSLLLIRSIVEITHSVNSFCYTPNDKYIDVSFLRLRVYAMHMYKC